MRTTRIAVASVAALTLALAGCGGSQPEEKAATPADPSEAATTAAEDTKEDLEQGNGFGIYEATDGGTVYTLDLTKPFDYTNDLIERTNKLMIKAITYGEDEEAELTEEQAEQIFQWSSLEIDNSQGSAEGSASMVPIQVVGDEMQYDIITDVDMFFNEMTTDYMDDESLSTDAYNEVVDVSNEWLDQDTDAKPGVKLTVPAIVSDMPDTIESVWFGDVEMQPKK